MMKTFHEILKELEKESGKETKNLGLLIDRLIEQKIARHESLYHKTKEKKND